MDAQTVWPEPIPFRWPDASFRGLDAEIAARLLAAAGDITLVLDAEGVIRDLAVGNPELAAGGASDWVGLHWAETVTSESRPKIAEMLRGTGWRGSHRWRHVNHALADGEVPVRYLAIDAGPEGGMVAIGRDLRATAALQQRLIQAQQAMERDHLRLRQAESRYRLLFNLSAEAVLIIDAATRRIVEANPAAEALVGAGKLLDQPFQAIAHELDREAAIALLGAAAAVDQATPSKLRVGAEGRECRVAVTLFRQGRHTFFLARLGGLGGDPSARDAAHLDDVLARVPDAFALTDESMTITAANPAFLEMTESARAADVIGQPLARFVGRPGIDPALIAAQLREHGSLNRFSTVVYGRSGMQEEVEVSAVAAPTPDRTSYGFTLRPAVRQREVLIPNPESPSSIEQLTDLVGRMSLKDIVRESTDLIERLCIEAALRFTADNRASAAEILGLSRQGLYSKLHRHGLTRVGSDEDK